jgi:DNA-binding FadR family transcriptional regulator
MTKNAGRCAALFGVGISTLRRALKGLDDLGVVLVSEGENFQATIRAKKGA